MVNTDELPDVLCSICYEPFDDDKHKSHIFKCGHHSCTACLKELQNTASGAVCMYCRDRNDTYTEDARRTSESLLALSTRFKDMMLFQINRNHYLAQRMEFRKVCATHNKPATLYDVPKAKPICIDCVKALKNLKLMTNIKSQQEIKAAKIQDLNEMRVFLEGLQAQQDQDMKGLKRKARMTELKKQVDETMKSRMDRLENEFKTLKTNLEKTHNAVLDNVKVYHDNLKAQINKGQEYIALYELAAKTQLKRIEEIKNAPESERNDKILAYDFSITDFVNIENELINSLTRENIEKKSEESLTRTRNLLQSIQNMVKDTQITRKDLKALARVNDPETVKKNLQLLKTVIENCKEYKKQKEVEPEIDAELNDLFTE